MLISEEYREQQAQMHAAPRGYGGANTDGYGAVCMRVIEQHAPVSVLDYGAGKGHLGEYLFSHGFKGFYRPYDPAIPYWSDTPQPSDLVCCFDVLEHIEPEYLDNVLADLQRVIVQRGCISVHHRLAKKSLPDGRNAHLIIEPPEWWHDKLARCFVITKEFPTFGVNDQQLLQTIFFVEPLP